MGAPRRMMAVAAGLALAATTVTAVAAQDRPAPPNDVVAAAWAAADDARTAAKALATAAEDDDIDDDAGEPQGRGTEAFIARHLELAKRHKDRPGNAARVHAALAEGESPAGLGQEQAAAKRGLGHARQALDGDERPGRGLGRDKAPGPPDDAGGDDDVDGDGLGGDTDDDDLDDE